MKKVTIDQMTIGEGAPKVIIPIVAPDEAGVIEKAKEAHELGADFIEWRIDFFKDVLTPGAIAKSSKKVKEAAQLPLLITFRSEREGGELALDDAGYFDLYQDILDNGTLDLLDVELYMPADNVESLIQLAHDKGVKVIMCNHDFDKTPAKDDIVERLTQMEEKGADIAKIAVMPNSSEDVLTLLNATYERYQQADIPLITMSMGQLGMISRLSGEVFGSSATFGAAGQGSAPGQAPVGQLQSILGLLSLNK
ncbi:MAG: type I 3-dehydroquinate dehydratase [Aerococcus sp.]|nr:type I 3-dehydroquinate dehydratase [Aerococcus sp.]